MSKRSNAVDAMPNAVLVQLRKLGGDLSVARKRRREPLKAWAQRIGVSMAVYATALWLMGRVHAIGDLAAPEHDQGALEDAVRVAKARAVRKRPSLYAAAMAGTHKTAGSDNQLPT